MLTGGLLTGKGERYGTSVHTCCWWGGLWHQQLHASSACSRAMATSFL